MANPFRLSKSHTPIYVGVVVLLLLVATFIITSVILYRHTVTLLTDNLRERLSTISITAAATIRGEDLLTLRTEEDWQKPEWAHVVGELHNAKYSNKDIVFMYIFRKTAEDPNQMEFVADADSVNPYANTDEITANDVDVNRDGKVEPDGPDKLQWPGQPYPEAVDIPEAWAAYEGPLTSADLYTDEYGTVMTGYAPIRDGGGNVVAILATDIKADDFFVVTRQTLYPFLLFISFLTFVIVVFNILLIRSVKKEVSLRELLEVANTGQANLLHIINHQIKGYMNKARIVFDALLTDPDYGPLPEPAKPLLNEGFNSVTEGVTFVQNFLNASNVERGTYTYNMMPVDFDKIVLAMADKQRSVAEAKGLTFEVKVGEGSYAFSGDKAQLEEAVKNLIDNSINYTPTGGLKVNLARNGNKMLLVVSDTGVGLSDEVKPKLFTKGGRDKDSIKININSTGFGLAFVKGVAEAHKGRVWADSAGVGKGSSFYLELPVS